MVARTFNLGTRTTIGNSYHWIMQALPIILYNNDHNIMHGAG